MAATCLLTLTETVLAGAGDVAGFAGAGCRTLYVASGDVTATDERFIRRFGADTGHYLEGPVELKAEADATCVWIFHLTAADAQPPLPDGTTVKLAREVDVPAASDRLMRLDRVDFPPGGAALTHTHPGPGIRIVLFGRIGVEQTGEQHWMGPGEAWFERGPDPVYAPTTEDGPTAFIRTMVLPPEWRGRNTISYVNPEDLHRPKAQRYRRFVDALIVTPRAR